jgi:hypothetical protein
VSDAETRLTAAFSHSVGIFQRVQILPEGLIVVLFLSNLRGEPNRSCQRKEQNGCGKTR